MTFWFLWREVSLREAIRHVWTTAVCALLGHVECEHKTYEDTGYTSVLTEHWIECRRCEKWTNVQVREP